MISQILKALLFIISILSTTLLQAQTFNVKAIRIGIDPIKSASFLFPERQTNHRFYYNTVEGYAEVMCFQRVSVVSEFGYSKSHLNKSNGNFDYFSDGKYIRLGLDFDLGSKQDRVETYIGGRVGLSSTTERGILTFTNDYYESTVVKDLGKNTKSHLWGEFAVTSKYKFNKDTPNGFYFATSFRYRFANYLPPFEKYRSYHIPGFGFFNSHNVGINFALFYQFKLKRRYLNDIKHRTRWRETGERDF